MFKLVIQKLGEPEAIKYSGAPGWHFYMLPLPDFDYLAFGAGETDQIARLRCLGEAAEILSVLQRPKDVDFLAFQLADTTERRVPASWVASSGARDANDLGNEGVAAAETFAQAWENAAWELIERAAVHDWWTGQTLAQLVPHEWKAEVGVLDLLCRARGASNSKRGVRLLSLPSKAGTPVFVSVICDDNGHMPVIGFAAGCDPARTAKRALSESIQMELSLALAIQAGPGKAGNRAIIERAEALMTTHSALIAPQGTPISPQQSQPTCTPSVEKGIGQDAMIVNLTRSDIRVAVARVIAPGLPSARRLKFGAGPSPI